MPRATRKGWRLAARVLESAAVADLAFTRVQSAYRHFLEGLLPSVLTDAELTDLSTRLYDRRGPRQFSEPMFDWEREWAEKYLPAPPGRVLVGGAGYGRECVWLHERGYSVDAYEPRAHAAKQCHDVVASRGGVCVVAAHQDLADAVLDRSENACAAFSRRTYAAVLLGWGSLSHVLDPEQRARIVEASARIAEGPVLASVRLSDRRVGLARASRFGQAIGRRFGGRVVRTATQYQPEVGLAATLLPSELEVVARQAQRRVEWAQRPGIAAVAFTT